MKYSLIIPCYNEAKNIPLLLNRCREMIISKKVEVILVDNGSTDNTAQVLKELLPKFPGCISIHVNVNQGYGFGILCGLRAATGAIIGWTHADSQHYFPEFFLKLGWHHRMIFHWICMLITKHEQ
jgi:glycosyltransferase involved in cell wall biosynthesis